MTCPDKLRYQFTKDYVEQTSYNLSDKCCYRMKKEIAHKYEKENNKNIAITGIRGEEGGMRAINGCTIFNGKSLERFHPLKVIDDKWENWFINKYQIKLCELYYPPYNFKRTGCKGCPFSLNLQQDLNTMAELLPNERRQCEIIWKPVYDEYRRIGYRLKPNIFDFLVDK